MPNSRIPFGVQRASMGFRFKWCAAASARQLLLPSECKDQLLVRNPGKQGGAKRAGICACSVVQFGPINSRSVSAVAQGAAFVKRRTQEGPAPILTRSGVNSGES